MSMTYDWSPLFSGITNGLQQYQWNKTLQGFLQPQGQVPAAGAQPAPALIHSNPIPSVQSPYGPVGGIPSQQMAPAPQAAPQVAGMDPTMARLLPLLKMMGPQAGLPMLLQSAMKQSEYDPTPRMGTNPNTGQLDQYLVSKDGTGVRWLGVKPREKMEVTNGTAYNPYDVKPGDQIGTPKTEKPIINEASGQMSTDNGQTWQPIPNFISRAAAIAGAKREDKPPNPTAPILLPHPSSGY